MGQSTNAILFYGYCWEDEARAPWELHPDYDPGDGPDEPGNGIDRDDEQWEDRYARLVCKLEEPKEPFPARTWDWKVPQKDRVYPPNEQVIVDKWSAFWAQRRALAEKSGISVDTHCSGDCPMPFVAIASTKVVSYRGSKTEIKLGMLLVANEWPQKLREFCEAMRIPVPDEGPKWWLVSDWH